MACRLPVLRVLGYTINLVSCRRLLIDTKMFADDIAILEELFHEGFVHDSNRAGWRGVHVGKFASLDHLRTDRVEISGACSHPGSVVFIAARRRWSLSFDIDSSAPVITFHRTVERVGNALHAGNSGKCV